MRYTYEHMEEFEGVVFPDFRQYDGNLILYGAGINGFICAFALQEMGVGFLCFCDQDQGKIGTSYLGHPVLSPTEAYQQHPDAAVLVDVYALGYDRQMLVKLGFRTILYPASLFLDLDCGRAADYFNKTFGQSEKGYRFRDKIDDLQVFEWIDEYMIRGVGYANGKKELCRAINLDITDRCTLRCKNCLSFKPFFREKRDVPWEKMEKIIDGITEMKWFRRFHLLGGETLLYRWMDKLIEKLTAIPEVEHINLITNGTVIPDEKTLSVFKNEKVMIRISYYGTISSQYQALVGKCRQEGIDVRVHAQRWTDIGRVLEYASDQMETQKRYNDCCQRNGSYFYVLHGKATLCPFAASTNALGLYPDNNEDFVDFLDNAPAQERFEGLTRLFWRKNPLEACKYCNGWSPYAGKSIPVAAQYAPGEQPELPKHG